MRPPLWDIMYGDRPYEPLPWQAEHIHAKADFKRLILACGRRSGKSEGVKGEVIREVMRPAETVMGLTHHPIVYVVAPTSELAMRVWQPVWDMFVPSDTGTYVPPLGFLYKNHDKARGMIWLNTGATIQRKTADDPRSLQGERVTLAVVDEAQDMPDEAWQNMMPALADSGGRLIAIGITRGKGRFRSYWERGMTGADPTFYAASVPTSANPIMFDVARREGYESVEAYIDQVLAADLTDTERMQQYYAQWVEEDGQVFRNLDSVFTGNLDPKDSEVVTAGAYIMGLDVAKQHDYTTAYVLDRKTMRVVATDRFNGLDWLSLGSRVASLYKRYRCAFIHMDTTGVGDPARDILAREGCLVIPFIFTNQSKAALINTLVREVEQKYVILPRDDTVLRREMELFEATVMPGGLVKYSAPPGYFDDCVIALALAVFKAAKQRRRQHDVNYGRYADFNRDRKVNRRMKVAA